MRYYLYIGIIWENVFIIIDTIIYYILLIVIFNINIRLEWKIFEN